MSPAIINGRDGHNEQLLAGPEIDNINYQSISNLIEDEA